MPTLDIHCVQGDHGHAAAAHATLSSARPSPECTSDPKGLNKGPALSTLLILHCVAAAERGSDFLNPIGPWSSRPPRACHWSVRVLRDLNNLVSRRMRKMRRRCIRHGVGVHAKSSGKCSRIAASRVQKARFREDGRGITITPRWLQDLVTVSMWQVCEAYQF